MILIEVKCWDSGITLVNIDKIRYMYEDRGSAFIVFSEENVLEIAESLPSVLLKIKRASKSLKTGGAK
jgi:hypothetical protein